MKKFKAVTKDFNEFLKDTDFVAVSLGLVIATSVRDLTVSFTSTIINPIVERFFTLVGITSGESITTIFTIDFQIITFISAVISFFLILFITFVLLKMYISIEKKNPIQKTDRHADLMEQLLIETKKQNELLEKQNKK